MSKKLPYYPTIELDAESGELLWSVMPDDYGDPAVEQKAVREGAGLFDFSCHWKWKVSGPDAKALLQMLMVNDMNKVDINGAIYTSMTNAKGGMIDDLIVYQMDETSYLLVSGLEEPDASFSWIVNHGKSKEVTIEDVTADLTEICVQGPLSKEVMCAVCSPGVETLEYFKGMWTYIEDMRVFISRTGYSGELGYEIFAEAADGKRVWQTVYDKGEPYGIKLVGMNPGGVYLPLEKGYICELDFNEKTNPYEMGLGWTVCLDKDFIGRDALMEVKKKGVANMLMSCQAEWDGILPFEAPIKAGEETIGYVTNSGYSYTFEKSICLAYVKAKYAVSGTEVTIETEDEGTVKAVLCEKTQYDPENKRVRG